MSDEEDRSLSLRESELLLVRLFPSPERDAEIAQLAATAPGDPWKPEPPHRHALRVLGVTVWSIFSNNFEVSTADGRCIDLGTFRGAGYFIADWLNRVAGSSSFEYTDFYMANGIEAWDEPVILELFRMVFRRLRALHADWTYDFPRLHVMDFLDVEAAGLPSAVRGPDRDERVSESLAERRRLEEEARAEAERALARPAPLIVRAYRDVYGRWPRGWPPVAIT
jgi:hypothetical protein